MPTSADRPELLLDTSAAVALVVADHEGHHATAATVGTRRIGLAGHAAFETFSVLTRLPPPLRRTPQVVAQILATSFPATTFLSAGAATHLLRSFAGAGIAGGSVYDALVAAVAKEHDVALLTRDHRAVPTYRSFEIELVVVD